MGIVVRQSITSTIISYCGVAIGYVNLLYLYPKFLDKEQVGLMRTIQDAAILFTPFAQFGLAQSMVRYFPRLVSSKESAGSFITLMLLLALTGFGIFFILFKVFESPILLYFEDNASAIISYSTLILWLTLILLIVAVLESYSRSLIKNTVPNLLREVVSRLLLAAFVSLYFSGYLTFHAFIISTAIAYLICLIILIAYLWAQGELKINFNLAGLDRTALPGLFKYSLLSFAGTAGLIIIGKVDSIMVTGMLGLAANAVYTTAFYMATVVEVPKRALSQIAMPLIARAFEKKDMDDIKTIYQKTAINQFIIGALILCGVWANLDNIFSIMPKGDGYEAGKWVVILVGFGKLMDMIFGPSSEIIVLSKYYGFNIILTLLLAVSVILLNNALIPIYGINGAAIGAALALIVFNFIKFIFIWVALKLQPFSWATLKVLGIAISAIALNYFIPKFDNVFLDIFIRSGIITVAYGALILVSKASPDGNKVFEKGLMFVGLRKSN
jgi:O-antigen/teichoic acid export membrane protein